MENGEQVFHINGIEMREIKNDNMMVKKKVMQNQNIEETKINFFDASKYDPDDLVYDMEKPEDDQIIEGKIDPEEWRKEIDRVYSDLDNIERDIELIKTRGSGDVTSELEECRRHIELIIDLCKDIKETCH